MGLGKYYSILEEKTDIEQAIYKIQLDANHQMYKGHFPDFPLLPGVVQMELIHELFEKTLGKELLLMASKNIKYLGMINPNEHKELSVKLSWKHTDEIKLKAEIISLDELPKTMLKYSAQYKFRA